MSEEEHAIPPCARMTAFAATHICERLSDAAYKKQESLTVASRAALIDTGDERTVAQACSLPFCLTVRHEKQAAKREQRLSAGSTGVRDLITVEQHLFELGALAI